MLPSFTGNLHCCKSGLSASKVRWLELSQLSLCSEFDKENSMEFSLISLPTYTFYYCGYALILPWSSCYSSHVTPCDCDLWCDHMWPSVTPLWHCDKVMWYFPTLHLVVVSPKKKKKKRNIDNDLAILPSHDKVALLPSSNSKATVSSLCSLPVPIYLKFSWIYLHFWVEREGVGMLRYMIYQRHLPTSVSHTY